ncbi:hemerythrin-like metal-binding protein [Candidatus Vecturithrix granuli]|uniref:Hemerythrin-like metal-binding protein n=1 Tax=Vecturithrix granuli TaxID=1499967 RepID=A0A081BXL2_VECG1|nr:hemerythrin-like metal-binding protein [Candidatus Vecturithrix granuli]
MELVQWNDRYLIGVKEIDAQHKYFVTLVNELHSKMQQHQIREIKTEIVPKLVDYVRKHFKDEERIMRRHNYPGLQEQIKAHQEILSNVNAIVNSNADAFPMAMKLMRLTTQWFLDHVLEHDLRLGKFLNSA